MPTIADAAVPIRRWDFSETSQTVSLFTREHGVVRGLAKGAKRERGSFSGGMDILTRGQIVAIVKPGRELATLTQWSLEEVFWPIRQNLAANRAGLYMADLIHQMLESHDPHTTLFDAFIEALRRLSSADSVAAALLKFQWTLLRETGYQPELATGGDCREVMVFSPVAGGVIDDNGGNGASRAWRVRRETIELLQRVSAGDVSAAVAPETIDRANRLLAAYIREVLGSEPPSMAWAFPGGLAAPVARER